MLASLAGQPFHSQPPCHLPCMFIHWILYFLPLNYSIRSLQSSRTYRNKCVPRGNFSAVPTARNALYPATTIHVPAGLHSSPKASVDFPVATWFLAASSERLSTCCHGEEPHVVGWRFINERRAINLDPNCGWARGKADILYVADAFQVVEKLNALLKEKDNCRAGLSHIAAGARHASFACGVFASRNLCSYNHDNCDGHHRFRVPSSASVLQPGRGFARFAPSLSH